MQPATHVARPLHGARAAAYPEGPLGVGDALWFVDYGADAVLRWQGGTARRMWQQRGAGPAALARPRRDELWVTCHDADAVVRLRLRPGRPRAPLRELGRHPLPTPNDMAVDAGGGVYVTCSGPFAPGPARGSLRYVAPGGRPRWLRGAIAYANGVALTRDGATLVVAEHLRDRLRCYGVRAPGALTSGHRCVALPGAAVPGHPRPQLLGPDGLHADPDGSLWVAHFAGGRLLHLDPGGRPLGEVDFAGAADLAGADVTNVCRLDGGTLAVTLRAPDGPGWALRLDVRGWDGRGRRRCAPPPGAAAAGHGD